MARVFVTGMAGFLGSHVAERFRDLGWDVTGIDDLSGGELANVPDGVRFLPLDCLDREAYAPIVKGADLVYHCAAAAYEGLGVFAPAFVCRSIAQATAEVASASVAGGVGRFVYLSSMARYGIGSPPFREDQAPAPVDPYGLAKHAAELIVRNLVTTHGGEFAVAVPHNIIGPRQRFDDPYRNVAAIMINRMLRGLQPVIYGDGSSRRCFSPIGDVLFCLEAMGTWEAAAGEVINIGPDEGSVTILELAQTIAGLLGMNLDPIFVDPRPCEVPVALCSSDKARRLLGYRGGSSLREGLASMIEWIERQGPRDFKYHANIEILTARTPLTWVEKLI